MRRCSHPSAPELFKILEVREASQRRSLKGLDNIATDGAAGFETLQKIVDELKSLGAESEWCVQSKTTLKACKRYLKTQYPVNCRHGQPSTCPDQCRNFALSDKLNAITSTILYATVVNL